MADWGFMNTTLAVTSSTFKMLMWPLFGIVFLIYIIVTLVLLYHWRRYGMKTAAIVLAEFVYFIGSAAILLLAVLALTFI